MVLSIQVTSQTESRLREQAQAVGKDVAAYVSELVEREAAKPALDAMLAPLRKQFAESGTTDARLVDEITAAQQAYRMDKRKRSA